MRIRWVKVWVDSLATLTERFRDDEGRVDFEALGREEYAFRHSLVTGDFSRSERARDLYDATINEITSRSEAGRKGAEARWNKNTAAAATREGADVMLSSESCSLERTTGCNPLTADGDTREDSLNVTDGSNSATLESRTSANNSKGDAVSSDATEVCPNRESGVVAPTTISTHSEAPQDQRAGGNSLRVAKVSTPPVRSSGPAKRPHGEFGNVLLTDDEFAKLQEKTPNAWDLITELDQYIESQGKTKKYKSHYATLLNWSRRKAQESKPQQRYKNINDINQENYEKAMREIEAMCAGEAV